MKTFILATFAAAASAHADLKNPTVIVADPLPLKLNTTDVGSMVAKSGWAKNGSGTDATLDMQLWMDWTKVEVGGKKWINKPDHSIHYLAIQNEDLSAFEGQKMTFSGDDAEPTMRMAYKTWDIAVPESFSEVDFGTDILPAKITAAGVDLSANFTAPVGFWSVDSALCANTADNWWLGLTRTTPGVAGITTGVTRMLTYQFDMRTGPTKDFSTGARATVEATWAADTSAPVVDPEETEDEDVPDVDNTNDNNEADDGASAVTTFGAAVIAAVASLAF